MPRFLMTVTETYTNSFHVEAEDEERAKEIAEERAVERNFPGGHIETCERTVEASQE